MTKHMINSCLDGKVIITWQSGRSPTISYNMSHALWVTQFKILRNFRKGVLSLQRNKVDNQNSKMGGDLRREEPDNLSTWKVMPKVSMKLEKGSLTSFMEKLADYDKGRVNLTITKNSENWCNGSFKIYGVKFKLDVCLIATVTSMPHTRLNFFRDLKFSNNTVNLFPRKEKERDRIGKAIGGYYEAGNIKKIWGWVLNTIMEYITVEGRFSRAHTYHFVLLNHFRHDKKVSLPYYLFRSLNKHSKNPSSPVLHCGLLLLIYEHCKTLALLENKRLSTSPGKRKMEGGDSGKEKASSSKKRKNAPGMETEEIEK